MLEEPRAGGERSGTKYKFMLTSGAETCRLSATGGTFISAKVKEHVSQDCRATVGGHLKTSQAAGASGSSSVDKARLSCGRSATARGGGGGGDDA